MANHPSAEKRNRQRLVRAERNQAVRSSLRTAVKKARAAIAAGNVEAAKAPVAAASIALAKAVSKGVVRARPPASKPRSTKSRAERFFAGLSASCPRV